MIFLWCMWCVCMWERGGGVEVLKVDNMSLILLLLEHITDNILSHVFCSLHRQ